MIIFAKNQLLMKKSLLLLFFLSFVIMVHSQQYEPQWVGEVAILKINGDTVSINTEKAIPQVKTTASAGQLLVGIGNVRKKAVFKNKRATTQINPEEPVVLVVKWSDNETDPSNFVQLVKFEETRKERKTELANVNWLGNVSEGNMQFVPYEARRYGNSSYILTFPAVEGEYGVRILNPNERDERAPVFYCFGIHAD